MKRLVYLLVLALVFGLSLFWYYRFEYPKMPMEIRALNKKIEKQNEKLISAQILAQELDLVAKLIEQNLAASANDSLAQDASLPFLEYITDVLNQEGIRLERLEPLKRRVTRHDFVKTSYEMTITCNFDEFGKFINELEKSERLVTVEAFEVKNQLEKAAAEKGKGKERFDTHLFEMRISTLTLIKHT